MGPERGTGALPAAASVFHTGSPGSCALGQHLCPGWWLVPGLFLAHPVASVMRVVVSWTARTPPAGQREEGVPAKTWPGGACHSPVTIELLGLKLEWAEPLSVLPVTVCPRNWVWGVREGGGRGPQDPVGKQILPLCLGSCFDVTLGDSSIAPESILRTEGRPGSQAPCLSPAGCQRGTQRWKEVPPRLL